MATSNDKTSLLLSYSTIDSDPRVRRQLDWLVEDGWTVDTVGLGTVATPGVRTHFAISKANKWVASMLGYALTGRVVPRHLSFRMQLLNRVPQELRDNVKRGKYALLVFNETEFLPWISDKRALGKSAHDSRVHVDLHEIHRPHRRRDTIGAKIAAPFYRWQRNHIGHKRIDSRTVVNGPIGMLYAEEFGFAPPVPIQNVPSFEDLSPVDRGDDRIRLLFHGMGSKLRGLEEMVDAMAALPEYFQMEFMLMPNEPVRRWLQSLIDKSPAAERMRIVPAVPLTEIAKRINDYDIEVVYLPPANDNLRLASPNKFFEAIQGRLALAVREDLVLSPLVEEWGNGIVVPGHSSEELAAALKDLTPADVQRMKWASDQVARKVNAHEEGKRFLEAVSD